ncbi:glycosyltransferase family 4 protein [Alteromonas sp. C1M14]|nr:glycosyltransferase family 4 protein [Alteromonas sp. C1M14]
MKPSLLWIKADELYPLNSGGKIRTYNMMVQLKAHYDITYFTLKAPGAAPTPNIQSYSDHQIFANWQDNKDSKLSLLTDVGKNVVGSSLPYVIDKYTTQSITDTLKGVLEDQHFDIVVCDFLSLSVNLTRLPKKPETTYVLFQHNVESYIWERHYKNAGNVASKIFYKNQWQRFKTFEQSTCQWFDGVIAVSDFDKQVFTEQFGLKNVLGHVETGVDLDFFAEIPRQPKPCSLVFLGSMDWMPNIDGIEDFIKHCYPKIKQALPQVTLTILGRNPPDKITQYGETDSSITVTGTVDDVRPYLAAASASIVPLRIGGGTRIKIFETMAAGLPVISTTIGAEGLPIKHNENIMIADDHSTFAEASVALLKDNEKAAQIAMNGYKLVKENYSWKTVTQDFVDMLNTASNK